MSPVDAAILRRKLQSIATYLDRLRPIARMTSAEYCGADRFLERKATERMLQEAIEAALDINSHLIAELGGDLPEDYYGGCVAIGQLGIVGIDFAAELAPSAGLRNRLVHEYDAIDDAKVFSSVETILRLYPRYVGAIEEFIEAQGL